MLYARCPSCGCTLAHIELPYIELVKKIENDTKMTDEEKNKYLREQLDVLIENDCCKMRLITYSDLVLILH